MLQISLEELTDLLKQVIFSESNEINEPAFEDKQEFKIPREIEIDQENNRQALGTMDTDAIYTSAKFKLYPIPESISPAALLVYLI